MAFDPNGLLLLVQHVLLLVGQCFHHTIAHMFHFFDMALRYFVNAS